MKFITYRTTYNYDNGMSTIHYHNLQREPEYKLGDETKVVLMRPDGSLKNVSCKIVSILQEIKETVEPEYEYIWVCEEE